MHGNFYYYFFKFYFVIQLNYVHYEVDITYKLQLHKIQHKHYL